MIDKAAAGLLDVNIRLVCSNRPAAGVLERARAAGLPRHCLDHTGFASRAEYDRELAAILRGHGVEWVVLAGYMRLLTADFLTAFAGQVINIHPAILPSFPGAHGGPDALAHGVRLTGCTVHFVEEQMDSGPIIIQAAVPVSAGEELESVMARVHRMEHRIYPQALQWLAQGRIRREGRQVYLAPAAPEISTVAPDGPWLVWPPLEAGF